MPVYHYSENERHAYNFLKSHNLVDMVVEDPLLVLEIKKV
jgi:hypothetical protein